MRARGDITAKFLEDCNIFSRNNIQAEYIINSEVSCGHDLTLIGKRGAFIGGSCSVYNCMNVKAVGAPSHIATSVTLGLTPQLMDEMEAVGKEMILLSRKLTELNKDISYLSGKLKEGTITPSQRERLSKLKLEAPINSLKEKKLKQQGAELSRKLREVGKSRLTAREVYPGTVINIGDCKMSISKKEDSCTFYYLDGEIKKEFVMADILRVTSPVINKNIIQPDKALKDPSVPFDMQEIRHITKNPSGSGLLGHHNVLEGEAGAATLMNLLKDPAVTVNYLKNIYMLEEIINLLPVNNNTVTQEIRQLFDALLIDPDHIVDELVDQEYASTLFKGELFDLLRGILEKAPDLRMETAELLKAVNASISRQDVLDSVANSLEYLSGQLAGSRNLPAFLECCRTGSAP